MGQMEDWYVRLQQVQANAAQQQQYNNPYALGNSNAAMRQVGYQDKGFRVAATSCYGKVTSPTQTTKPEKKSMFKEITADIKGFLLEHRGVIYFIAAALILDHFFFRGAFKARLQGMAEKVVTKVEEKIQ